jgi:hypothetical protein
MSTDKIASGFDGVQGSRTSLDDHGINVKVPIGDELANTPGTDATLLEEQVWWHIIGSGECWCTGLSVFEPAFLADLYGQ